MISLLVHHSFPTMTLLSMIPFLTAGSMSSKNGQPLVGMGDYQREAFRRLPKNALDYYQSGALDQETLQENKDAMRR